MLSEIPIAGPALLQKRSDLNAGEASKRKGHDKTVSCNAGASSQHTNSGEIAVTIDIEDSIWKMISQYVDSRTKLYAKYVFMALSMLWLSAGLRIIKTTMKRGKVEVQACANHFHQPNLVVLLFF